MVTAGVLLWWPEGLSINTKSILFYGKPLVNPGCEFDKCSFEIYN